MVTARHNYEDDEPEVWYGESVLRQLAENLRDNHNLVPALFPLSRIAEDGMSIGKEERVPAGIETVGLI